MAKRIRSVKSIQSKLVEAVWKGKTSVVLCVKCYLKRKIETPRNMSMYNRDVLPIYTHKLVAKWEDVKCADCGQENRNTNFEPIRLERDKFINHELWYLCDI